MKAFKLLTLILSVTVLAFSTSAQTIKKSSQSNSWPQPADTSQAKAESELVKAEVDEDLDDLAADANSGESIPAEVVAEAQAAQKDKDDAAAIENDLAEVDDLLATDDSAAQYEVIETQYIDGKPVTSTKKVSKAELDKIISKNKSAGTVTRSKNLSQINSKSAKTSMTKSAVTTSKVSSTVVKKGKPRRRIVRRVLRTRKKPKTAASNSSSHTTTTTVKTRVPVAPKKKKLHIMPVLGASYGRIEGDFLANRFQNSLESDFGLTGGVLVEYSEDDWMFGFETGMMYLQTVVTGDNSLVTAASLDHMMNEYLMFPVALKFYPVRKEAFKMFIKGGLAGGVLLDSNFQQRTLGTLAVSGNSGGLFKDGEFQWLAGIGAKFQITKDFSIGVEGQMFRSLSDITDASSNTQGGEARNFGASAFGGLIIDI